jgi:uncharacterized protein
VRAIFDTNVVISGLVWEGTLYPLIDAAVDGKVQLFTSPTLLTELRRILGKDYVAAKLSSKNYSADQVFAIYCELAELVYPNSVPRVIANDADDDHVIACALAANVDIIVSGDKHLHSLGISYRGIQILRPAQAVVLINAEN